MSQWWERLTKQEKRPLFLAPDFDRWLDESDAEMELRAKAEERLNKLRLESQGSPETLTSLKKRYLFMYNLVQSLGFSWILSIWSCGSLSWEKSPFMTHSTPWLTWCISARCWHCGNYQWKLSNWSHRLTSVAFSYSASWKKFHFVYHLWHHGRNANQSCGFPCVSYVEHNWKFQIPLLYALLHWHGLEGAHMASLHCVDSRIPSGMFGRRYFQEFQVS